MYDRSIRIAVALLTLATSGAGSAYASLGGDAATVEQDAQALRGVLQPKAATAAAMAVEEIDTDNGMRVREFLNGQGVVFAVAWEGPVMPNLAQLLGAQFSSYTAALTARDRPALRPGVRVATPELVVESEGHLRAFVGRAYLPALLPPGTTLSQLR